MAPSDLRLLALRMQEGVCKYFQGARHCSKCLTKVNLFNPQSSPMIDVLLLSLSFYR